MRKHPALWFYAGSVVLLLVWEGCARFFDSPLLLPGPLLTLRTFIQLVPTPRFLGSLAQSFARVMMGIMVSIPLGILAGAAAGLDRRAGFFLRPLFTIVAATPVMAIILIVFLWLGTEMTPVFTAFLMVFPVMAANTREAVAAVDTRLIELCEAFEIRGWRRFHRLYLPSMLPYLLAGVKASLSLSWKVVAAAEIIVQPALALGTGMQTAKANLETAELFAWTCAAVLAAGLCEALLTFVIKLCRIRTSKTTGTD